jgi:hypothetical protein
MNIIELAKQAGLQTDNAGVWVDDGYIDDQLEAFAKLVAAHEREACAKVCESNVWSKDVSWWLGSTKSEVGAESGFQCAAAIRARGEA